MAMGYDPYNSDLFVKLWQQYNSPFAIEVVNQGVRTESVPLGEIKKVVRRSITNIQPADI